MKAARTPPVPFADFERISRGILGMLESEMADITASCLFFGLIGESILRRHYKIEARAMVGEAFYRLGGEHVIAFARHGEHQGFHCWVEAQGWFIDFSAIVFPEIVSALGHPPCRRLMFQKPLSKAALSAAELPANGGFHCLADSALTQAHRAEFHARLAYDDLLNIVTDWYRKPPTAMPVINVYDKYGNAKPASIAGKRLVGVW